MESALVQPDLPQPLTEPLVELVHLTVMFVLPQPNVPLVSLHTPYNPPDLVH